MENKFQIEKWNEKINTNENFSAQYLGQRIGVFYVLFSFDYFTVAVCALHTLEPRETEDEIHSENCCT